RQANETPGAGKNQKSKNLKTQTIMKTILFFVMALALIVGISLDSGGPGITRDRQLSKPLMDHGGGTLTITLPDGGGGRLQSVNSPEGGGPGFPFA
ncbi:MAG: hypothetical protein NT004_07140, partial [Bacteroidetes bacterium]|nr:hypothetical protein [Bacteroidota bacterium]